MYPGNLYIVLKFGVAVIPFFTGLLFVRASISLVDIVLGKYMRSIHCRHWFTNACSFCILTCVILHVVEPYKNTDLTLLLKNGVWFCDWCCQKSYTCFVYMGSMSSWNPLVVAIKLPTWQKESTLSMLITLSVRSVVIFLPIRLSFAFLLFILRPINALFSDSLFSLVWMSSNRWDISQMSSV